MLSWKEKYSKLLYVIQKLDSSTIRSYNAVLFSLTKIMFDKYIFESQRFFHTKRKKIFIRNTKEIEEITVKQYQVRLRKQKTIASYASSEEIGRANRVAVTTRSSPAM